MISSKEFWKNYEKAIYLLERLESPEIKLLNRIKSYILPNKPTTTHIALLPPSPESNLPEENKPNFSA